MLNKIGRSDSKNWEGLTQKTGSDSKIWEGLTPKRRRTGKNWWEGLTHEIGRTDLLSYFRENDFAGFSKSILHKIVYFNSVFYYILNSAALKQSK